MSPGKSRSRSPPEFRHDSYRIHISDLSSSCSKQEIEKAFEAFGHVIEVWVARKPPCFAFVVYKHQSDAEKAIQAMDGQCLEGGRIRVSWARPRAKGMAPIVMSPSESRGDRRSDSELRCYQCGGLGHFSKSCTEVWHFKKGYVRSSRTPSTNSSRSRSRSRSHRRSRRSRSRSRRHHRDRRSRSRSRGRDDRRRNDSPRRSSSHRHKQQTSSRSRRS